MLVRCRILGLSRAIHQHIVHQKLKAGNILQTKIVMLSDFQTRVVLQQIRDSIEHEKTKDTLENIRRIVV